MKVLRCHCHIRFSLDRLMALGSLAKIIWYSPISSMISFTISGRSYCKRILFVLDKQLSCNVCVCVCVWYLIIA